MGKINTIKTEDYGSDKKKPYQNAMYVGEAEVPDNIIDTKKGVISFLYYNNTPNKISTIKGHVLHSQDLGSPTVISPWTLVNIFVHPDNAPGNQLFVSRADDFENFRSTNLFRFYHYYNEVSFEKAKDPKYPHPYIAPISGDIAHKLGLGNVFGILMYFPHTDAYTTQVEAVQFGTQIFIRNGSGRPVKENPINIQDYNNIPYYRIATRSGEGPNWTRWTFDGKFDGHYNRNIHVTSPNPDGSNWTEAQDCNDIVMNASPSYFPVNATNKPPFFADGVIMPLTFHDGLPDHYNVNTGDPAASYDVYLANKHFVQLAVTWTGETMMAIRSYARGGGATEETRWKKWERVLTDRGPVLVDRRFENTIKPTISLAVGKHDMGLNYWWENALGFVCTGKTLCFVDTNGLHMVKNSVHSVHKIQGGWYGENDPENRKIYILGEIYLNTDNADPVIFRAKDGSHRSLQDIWEKVKNL